VAYPKLARDIAVAGDLQGWPEKALCLSVDSTARTPTSFQGARAGPTHWGYDQSDRHKSFLWEGSALMNRLRE
jgi:hypothetical protein